MLLQIIATGKPPIFLQSAVVQNYLNELKLPPIFLHTQVSKAPKPAKASKTAAKKTTEGKTVAKIPRVRTKTSDNSDIKTVRTVKVKPKADARNAEKTVIVKDADDDDKLYETSAPKTKYNFKRGQCVKDVYGGKEYTVLSVTKGPGSLARLVENSTGFDCTVAVADLVPGKGKPREIEE